MSVRSRIRSGAMAEGHGVGVSAPSAITSRRGSCQLYGHHTPSRCGYTNREAPPDLVLADHQGRSQADHTVAVQRPVEHEAAREARPSEAARQVGIVEVEPHEQTDAAHLDEVAAPAKRTQRAAQRAAEAL